MNATYVSVWDGGTRISTSCFYNPDTRRVSDIESTEVEELDVCEKEYVELPDGTELEVLSFESFQNMWVKQECDCGDDTGQLKQAIEECDDFDDLLDTIRVWSNKPVTERVYNFLKRNNACIIED